VRSEREGCSVRKVNMMQCCPWLWMHSLQVHLEERRKAAWQPEPGATVQEKRMHWEQVAAQRSAKIEEGEYIEDELLPKLRDDRDMIRLGREFLKAAERGNTPVVAPISRKDSRPTTKTGRRKKRRCIFPPARGRARFCASFSIAGFVISC